MTVRYTRTPPDVATFDTYRFMLSDPAVPVKEKRENDTDRKVQFISLMNVDSSQEKPKSLCDHLSLDETEMLF